MRLLLEKGADGTVPNKSGSTALHLAVQNTGRGGSGEEGAKDAQREIIALLLVAGLRPDLQDGKGKTVMEWARSEWVRRELGGCE